MTIDRYLAHRRRWEFLLATLLLFVSLAANTAVVAIELARSDEPYPAWLPLLLEGTSHLGLAVVIPLIIWFDGHFPIRTQTMKTALPAHAAFSVAVSAVHVAIMYLARVALSRWLMPATPYHWDDKLANFGYEYLKDFRTYLLILALVYLYRFVIRRLQGEAGLVDDSPDGGGRVSDRILVKKLGREFLVRLEDVDWIEASGNYVNLHVGQRVYPLRGTMTSISERLLPHGFQRVHRSAIVNLERVAEIVAYDSGDGEARLSSNVTVPVSRRFRKELRQRLA